MLCIAIQCTDSHLPVLSSGGGVDMPNDPVHYALDYDRQTRTLPGQRVG